MFLFSFSLSLFLFYLLDVGNNNIGGVVTQSAFNEFWTNWYGPVMKLIYQKHGRVLWDRR